MLHDHRTPDGVVKVVKMTRVWPGDWPSCVRLARLKFEKYYNHTVHRIDLEPFNLNTHSPGRDDIADLLLM